MVPNKRALINIPENIIKIDTTRVEVVRDPTSPEFRAITP